MAHQKYYVVFHEGAWKITYNGERYGPYTSQRKAYESAVDAAQKAGKRGDQAQVFIQRRDNNEFRVEWTYGNDPYPPPG